jgi:tetratricopeptide (TPR) repeat protein
MPDNDERRIVEVNELVRRPNRDLKVPAVYGAFHPFPSAIDRERHGQTIRQENVEGAESGLQGQASSRPPNGLLSITSCLVTFLLIVLFTPRLSLADANDIYRRNSPAVVVVIALDGTGRPTAQGSGFIVRQDGAVVTNYHVINLADDIKVKMGATIRNVEGVLHADPENDLAIIKLEGENYPIVKVGDADALQVGERIYVIGSPRGLENTISEGLLSGIRKVDATRKILQMTASISPGSSGGPVFNDKGEAVGVATFLIEENQNLNFAMPINLAKEGLSRKESVKPRDACQVDFKETAACWSYQGLAWGARGDHDRAAEAFKHSLDIDSGTIETYASLGISYSMAGKYDEAIEMFTKAIEMDPRRSEVLTLLGAAYNSAGRHRQALDTLRKAIAIEPHPQSFYHFAVALGSVGRHKEAIGAAIKATQLDPDYFEAHKYLAFEYSRLRLYREAASAYKTGIRLNPDEPTMHLGLGTSYARMGDKASALEEYKILKKIDPVSARKLFDLIYK